MIILYILLALLLLGILIAVHEFGHFISARACGIEVKEFALGFGPVLLKRQSKKSGTLFTLRPIPLGGFCMFYGDTDDDPEAVRQDDPRCYNNAPAWKRLISVLCGPLMNFVLAAAVAFGFFAFLGTEAGPVIGTVLYSVEEGSPAAEAGLLPGDRVIAVGDTGTDGQSYETVSALLDEEPDAAVRLTVLRGEEELSFSVPRRWNAEEGRWLMGVTLAVQQQSVRIPLRRVPSAAWDYLTGSTAAMIRSIRDLFTGGVPLDEVSGPVGIVRLVAEETRDYGAYVYLQLLMLISVNLGLMNLLPIPGLDGSHAVFLLIEMILRKPVPRRIEAVIHACGYVLLLALMVLITFKDVWKLVG